MVVKSACIVDLWLLVGVRFFLRLVLASQAHTAWPIFKCMMAPCVLCIFMDELFKQHDPFCKAAVKHNLSFLPFAPIGSRCKDFRAFKCTQAQ